MDWVVRKILVMIRTQVSSAKSHPTLTGLDHGVGQTFLAPNGGGWFFLPREDGAPGSLLPCPGLEDRRLAQGRSFAYRFYRAIDKKSCKCFSFAKANFKHPFLAHVAHIPDLCCFQGESGRDSQQRGPKGETGDIGPMVRHSLFLHTLC